MQVIEKIIDNRLGFNVLVNHCTKSFKGLLDFHIYDSIRGSHFCLTADCDEIASYIAEHHVLCTMNNYDAYFTMSRDAVKLYESKVVDYITTRPSSSKPRLCIVAFSDDDLFMEVEFSPTYRVNTNVFDLLIDGAGVVDSDGNYVLNALYSTLELVYNVKNVTYLNKLITKHKILKGI